MVDERRLKKKLPSLLMDGELSDRDGWNNYFRKRYGLNHMAQREPVRFRSLLLGVAKALDRMDEALYLSAEETFGKRVKRK